MNIWIYSMKLQCSPKIYDNLFSETCVYINRKNLTELWTQGCCRCCHCGQDQDNQGLDLQPWEDPWDGKSRGDPWDKDHHLGHPPSDEAAWRSDLRLLDWVKLSPSLLRLVQLVPKILQILLMFNSIPFALHKDVVVRSFLRSHKLGSHWKYRNITYPPFSVKWSEK